MHFKGAWLFKLKKQVSAFRGSGSKKGHLFSGDARYQKVSTLALPSGFHSGVTSNLTNFLIAELGGFAVFLFLRR
jgi:hypothetical protein